MAQIPRQTLDELIAKYELHPNLVDVYVEGCFDRDFIYQYLEATGRRADVSVYAIDDIDIPHELVAAAGFNAGSNKCRVLTLARSLTDRPNLAILNVICIIDADLDRLFGAIRDSKPVVYTDYSCMEMYSLTEATLRKFLNFTCNLDERALQEFMTIAASILPAQFLLRAIIEALGLRIAAPSASAGLAQKRDLTTFSHHRYLDSFIRTNGLVSRQEEIEHLLRDLQTRLERDLRHKANGHDFVELLFDFSWLRGGVKLHSKDRDVIQFGGRLVASGIDFSALAAEPMFSAINSLALASG